MELSKTNTMRPLETFLVTSPDSPEFSRLRSALLHSSVVALDAEWKPVRSCPIADRSDNKGGGPSFPTVTLLQIACRLHREAFDSECPVLGSSPVFLVDLLSLPLSTVWELLKETFVSPSVLKLGFRFKQDLVYLSSTFSSQGCFPGFDKVEPFIEITSIYYYMKYQNCGKKLPKDTISLATICSEILGIPLSKELQCSDWSCRPLTEGQITYAAADAYYLLEIFAAFQQMLLTEGKSCSIQSELKYSKTTGGLKEIFVDSEFCKNIVGIKSCSAVDMIRSSCTTVNRLERTRIGTSSQPCHKATYSIDEHLLSIVKVYGETILLKESDRKPRFSRRKKERLFSVNTKAREQFEVNEDWEGPGPWDQEFGGDGYPKFLCDVMVGTSEASFDSRQEIANARQFQFLHPPDQNVEGLARHLRCVGIDAAVPVLRKPESRQLMDQAYKEKRVLLTRDAKLMKHQYLASNQVYRVKSLLKKDQLLEVIETFHLNISEEQLMSRCTKCNGSFIQKPLTHEEAIEASKGFQIIPSCLFNKDTEFWQCTDCRQLYWEGNQYHNAIEKFVNICKLST